MSLLSKKYVRNKFMEHGIQVNEIALENICDKLKDDISKYAMNAKDLGVKRITKDKVPIIIGDFDA